MVVAREVGTVGGSVGGWGGKVAVEDLVAGRAVADLAPCCVERMPGTTHTPCMNTVRRTREGRRNRIALVRREGSTNLLLTCARLAHVVAVLCAKVRIVVHAAFAAPTQAFENQ